MQEHKIRNLDRYCALVEAILFATPKPLTLGEIARISRINPGYIPEILKILQIRYQGSSHGITLSRLGDSFKVSVKNEFVGRIAGLTKSELSRGLLRVLSLIAYNQPVQQSDIVKIIGNRTYEYVKELEKLGFVKGERKGKSKELSTTPAFESYFETSPAELKKEMEKLKLEEKLKEQEKKQEESEKQEEADEPGD